MQRNETGTPTRKPQVQRSTTKKEHARKNTEKATARRLKSTGKDAHLANLTGAPTPTAGRGDPSSRRTFLHVGRRLARAVALIGRAIARAGRRAIALIGRAVAQAGRIECDRGPHPYRRSWRPLQPQNSVMLLTCAFFRRLRANARTPSRRDG